MFGSCAQADFWKLILITAPCVDAEAVTPTTSAANMLTSKAHFFIASLLLSGYIVTRCTFGVESPVRIRGCPHRRCGPARNAALDRAEHVEQSPSRSSSAKIG